MSNALCGDSGVNFNWWGKNCKSLFRTTWSQLIALGLEWPYKPNMLIPVRTVCRLGDCSSHFAKRSLERNNRVESDTHNQ